MIAVYDGRENLSDALKALNRRRSSTGEDVRKAVVDILTQVREHGDEALLKYTKKFDWDGANLSNLRVQQWEIEEALALVDESVKNALRHAAENIRLYHEKQKREGYMMGEAGARVGQLIRPLNRVGVYVPGGTAAYPSTVLMNVIPAKVAGVQEIVMVTPATKEGKIPPLTLVAANEAGVDKIFRIGGAQAVAALAYGTTLVPRVDKIVGPGNSYVATAKREVFGAVGIDMIAGPSEVLVIADSTADPAYAAADLLSQAEHDPHAAAYLVTDDPLLAENVKRELVQQTARLSRWEIVERSLREQSAIILTKNMQDAVRAANAVAPEHLELLVQRPGALLDQIQNAGAVFMGEYSPEPLGDYMAGTNHVLPTSGTARFSSALSVDDFIKKTSVVFYNRSNLLDVAEDIMVLAETEGLDAHANAIRIRTER